jgi:hypothetical protein
MMPGSMVSERLGWEMARSQFRMGLDPLDSAEVGQLGTAKECALRP